jgi:MFS family permease
MSVKDASAGRGFAFRDRYFPAFAHRNFRIFWTGQCVSLIGTWMQNVGQSWLVLELTDSPLRLGAVSAVQFMPMMLFSLFAGPFVDRFPKRRTLLITQSLLLLLALSMSVLTWTGVIRYWMILVMALVQGFVNTIDIPTRQSYVIELTGRDSLMNAVSLNSAAFNLARILGPAVAGVLIGAVGIPLCYSLNALSFLAVIAALFAIDAPPIAGDRPVQNFRDVLASAREGLAYIGRRREIALPLVLLAVISTFVINYNVFVPTFARGPLGRDASGYGFLMTSMGIGSLFAALLLAVRSRKGPSFARLLGGALGMCAAIAACGFQRSYALSCVLLGLTGFCTITFTASTNATVQLGSDDAHRGRVMSVFALVFSGVTPIGGLYAGAVIDAAGPAFCLILSGGIGLAFAVWLGLVMRSRNARPRAGDRYPAS